jgi:uncharacterized membrane protein
MPDPRVRISRRLAWISLAALAVLQLLVSFQQPTPTLVWIMRVLPLLIFLPGIIADNLRSYIWLCFVCLLYFVTLVLRLFADPFSIVAILAMTSVVTLFIAAMLYVRWRAQEMKEELVDE